MWFGSLTEKFWASGFDTFEAEGIFLALGRGQIIVAHVFLLILLM